MPRQRGAALAAASAGAGAVSTGGPHQRRETRRQPLDDEVVDDRPGPETRAGDHDELRFALAALDRLPEIDGAAVLMRADEGLAYEESTAALALSVASAREKVHRAWLRLAEVLPADQTSLECRPAVRRRSGRGPRAPAPQPCAPRGRRRLRSALPHSPAASVRGPGPRRASQSRSMSSTRRFFAFPWSVRFVVTGL